MNNLCWQNTDNTMHDSVGGNTFSHNMFSDPSFVNRTAGNFDISGSSAAIDAGTLISTVKSDFRGLPRPQGANFDIGAFEYSGGIHTSRPPSAPTNVRIVQ